MSLARAQLRWCRRYGHAIARMDDREQDVTLTWCLICKATTEGVHQ